MASVSTFERLTDDPEVRLTAVETEGVYRAFRCRHFFEPDYDGGYSVCRIDGPQGRFAIVTLCDSCVDR